MVAPLALLGLNVAADVAGKVAKAVAGPAGGQATDRQARLKKTAQDFEAMFLEQSFDRLTENGGQEGPLGEAGTGGGIYRSMLAKEYAGQVVKSGGVGISGQVYRQLLQLQEGTSGAAAG